MKKDIYTDVKKLNLSKYKLNNTEKIIDNKRPDRKPKYVLFGLIFGIIFLSPKKDPKTYDIVSNIIMIIKKYIKKNLS